ncbi:protein-serine,threonine phosphatase [Sarracenia purpurea var. burkii]
MEDTILHLYGTDALKDVSSYQQKFCRISFFLDELPSPTPSEGSDNGDGDIGGEISSSSIVGDVQTLVAPALAQSIVSSPSHVDALDLNQRVLPMFNTESKVDGWLWGNDNLREVEAC